MYASPCFSFEQLNIKIIAPKLFCVDFIHDQFHRTYATLMYYKVEKGLFSIWYVLCKPAES